MKSFTSLAIIGLFLIACSDGGGGKANNGFNNQNNSNNVNNRPALTLEQYDANMAQWRCRMFIDCCVDDQMLLGLHDEYNDYESCMAGETGAIVSDYEDNPNLVLQEVVTEAWYAHLDYYGTGCEARPDAEHRAALWSAEDRLSTGLVGVGGACFNSLECADGLECAWENGTCVALPLEDEPCPDGKCGAGLVCNIQNRTCVVALREGDPCNHDLGLPCLDPYDALTCDATTDRCVLKFTAGSPCQSHNECRSGVCNNAQDVCQPSDTGDYLTYEEFCLDLDPYK